MKILICGGPGVGKSSFLHRLTGESNVFQSQASITASIAVVSMNFGDGGSTQIHIWEVASKMIEEPLQTCEKYFCDVDATILIVDAGDAKSLKDIDDWLYLLNIHKGTVGVPKYLVVNKADSSEKVISSDLIETFTRSEGIHDWFYTVGDSNLCDYDHARGSLLKQSSPVDILRKLISLIEQLKKVAIIGDLHNSRLLSSPTPNPIISLTSFYLVRSLTDSSDVPENMIRTWGSFLVMQVYPRRSLYLSSHIPKAEIMSSHEKLLNRKPTLESKDSPPSDSSWPYNASAINREDAEVLLSGFPDGTFLLRSIHDNELRISIKESKFKMMHTPIRRTGGSTDMIRCGRTELRGIQFDTISALFESLHLIQSQCLVFI